MPATDDESGQDVVHDAGVSMVTEDGVTLVSDVWRPAGAGSWPVLLQRLPYGRAVASTPVLPHPSWFARRGFVVVVQDCRGRGDSDGTFTPFVDEARDGAATIEWAAALPFSDGRVATYGFSYQGLAQLYAAARRPPSLRGVAAMMCCPDPYEGWTYEGGCLRLPFVAFWSAQLAGQEHRRGPDRYDVGSLPVSAALGDDPPRWFTEWLEHPSDDAYWAERRPDLSMIDVPVFTVLGYFDDFSSGTARIIDALDAEAVCGPWTHMPWGSRHGGAELGDEASPAIVSERLVAFFDRVFDREQRPSRERSARVTYLSVGSGWRTASTWPPPGPVEPLDGDERWERQLAPRRREPRTWRRRSRSPRRAGGRAPRAVSGRRGGPSGRGRGGGSPRRALLHERRPGRRARPGRQCSDDDRRDVRSPASRPRGHARPGLTRWLVTRCACGARRCRTDPHNASTEHTIELRPIAWRCPAGTRLRLDVSGARFPAFDRNPQSAVAPAHARAEDTVVATITVQSVRLDLPIDLGPGGSM